MNRLVSYKRDKNIKDILVHRKHNLQFYGKENGCKACGEKCALCSHIIESTSFKDNEFIVFCVQNVNKIFMSDKLVISFINECY